MGAGADVNAFFGVMTMVIAIPTSVLVFNWIATMYKGRIRFETPMLWFLGFAAIFAIGGISGVMLAIPPVDFQLHNSLFLVAHFHSTVIGGVLFGIFCALSYWFPKFTGFRLNERLGRYAFWCWIIGFCMSFIPMYVLGFMGASRRLDHYDASTGWQPLFIMMFLGGLVIAAGVGFQVAQILASIIQKNRLRDTTGGDIWDGRTLEWSTPSAPPFYNFTVIPEVSTRDAFLEFKNHIHPKPVYEDIHMPKNTAVGIYISIFATLASFAFVWDIVWLIAVSLLGIIVTFIIRGFNEDSEYTIPAQEIQKLEEARINKFAADDAAGHGKEYKSEEDMGLIELIRVVVAFFWDIVKNKRWKKW
jgi:cytochrome o ubiquinol oxidase subunit 1